VYDNSKSLSYEFTATQDVDPNTVAAIVKDFIDYVTRPGGTRGVSADHPLMQIVKLKDYSNAAEASDVIAESYVETKMSGRF
jgi:hypothetical protein